MHFKKEINVFWFKRDLRLLNNEGLQEAIHSGLPLLLLYVMEVSLKKIRTTTNLRRKRKRILAMHTLPDRKNIMD